MKLTYDEKLCILRSENGDCLAELNGTREENAQLAPLFVNAEACANTVAHVEEELDRAGVPRDTETPDGAPNDAPGWRVYQLRLERDALRKNNNELLDQRFKLSEQVAALLAQLQTVLDHVDYMSGACRMGEPVAAALPKEIIARARAVILDAKGGA